MSLREVSPELLVADDDVVALDAADVESLKRRAASVPLKRSRVCAHGSSEDPLHEMLIVLDRATYVRPHKHKGKSESFHVVEGAADVVLFDDDGAVEDVIELGDYRSGRSFFYRLNVAAFHTVVVRTDTFTIHETTNGPFRADDAVYAAWAPESTDDAARTAYLADLDVRIREHLQRG
jgi:cupin fold WbuC family metalloprotein